MTQWNSTVPNTSPGHSQNLPPIRRKPMANAVPMTMHMNALTGRRSGRNASAVPARSLFLRRKAKTPSAMIKSAAAAYSASSIYAGLPARMKLSARPEP